MLYVEDNPTNVELMRTILGARSDLDLLSTATAADGVRLANDRRPAAIIVDLHLPDGRADGFLETFSAVAPVIVVTADLGVEPEPLFASGATHVFTKPVGAARLLEALAHIIPPER